VFVLGYLAAATGLDCLAAAIGLGGLVTGLVAPAIGLAGLAIVLAMGTSISIVTGSMRTLGTGTTTSTSTIGRLVPIGGDAIRRDSRTRTITPGVTAAIALAAGGDGPRPAR